MNRECFDPNRLAAVVYDDGVAVDALLSELAAEFVAAGVRARGLVQLPPDASAGGSSAAMRLRDVETGEILAIYQDLGPGAVSCKLDSAALAAAAMRLRRAAEAPSDIVFVSKFGKQEAAGGGFRAELALAVAEGRTVLTAVKSALLPKWEEFTGGQGTLLEGRACVVRDWWADIQRFGPTDA